MSNRDQINFDREHLTDLTGTIVEPVDLATMKTHLRVDFDDDDAMIAMYTTAAREWIEQKTNFLMTNRTFRADLPRFFETIVFPWREMIQVNRVDYWTNESPSVLTTMFDRTAASPENDPVQFRVDPGRRRLYRVSGQSWPTVDRGRHDAVQITFQAGPGLTGSPEQPDAPDALKAALMLLVGDLYEHREIHVTGTIVSSMPTADRLLSLWKVFA